MGGWLNKLLQPYIRILFKNKLEETIDTCNKLDKNTENHAEGVLPILKEYLLREFIHITVLHHYFNTKIVELEKRSMATKS